MLYDKEELENALHYLKVIKHEMSYFQPEARHAINYAIEALQAIRDEGKPVNLSESKISTSDSK